MQNQSFSRSFLGSMFLVMALTSSVVATNSVSTTQLSGTITDAAPAHAMSRTGTNATQMHLSSAAASNAAIQTNAARVTNSSAVPHFATANQLPTTNTAVPIERTDYSKWGALVISLIALGHTVWKDHKTGKRMKAIEAEQEREKSEAAVRRSKASAPYFSPSTEMFNILYENSDDGGLGVWTFGNANVLTNPQKEMPKDAPEGTPVIMILNTNGKGARRIKISGDIPKFELRQEPETHGAKGRVFLKYPYKPMQHGNTQKVVLSFETEDGFDLTHTYETRHGCFEFHRVDPN